MKNDQIKNILVFFIVILFILSSIMPMVFSVKSESVKKDTELGKELENLAFIYTEPNSFNSIKYEHYKQQLIKQYSSKEKYGGDMAKTANTIIQIKTQSALLSFGSADSAWPMKCHDTRHTGRSSYSTAIYSGIEKWRFYCGGWVDSGIAIDNDGTLYCKGAYNSLDRYLYAINPDGTEKWKYKTDGLILGSSPAIAEDGTVYVGSWDCYLYAIYPNGMLRWKFATGGSIFSSPTVGEDGTIYIGNNGNKIWAINPNGTGKWCYVTGYLITSDPAVGNDGTVYIGSQDNYLYALWPNGTLRWRYQTGESIMGPPSVADDGTIYIGSWDGYLYALYPNGTKKWQCGIGYGTATNPSIGSDGTIYCGSKKLYAVNPNGSMKWSFNLGSEQHHIEGSSPAISANGIVYVGVEIGDANGGEIIAVNPDGTERWRKKIASFAVDSSPSIAEDGTIYIGSSCSQGRGYLHAFGPIESNNPPYAPTISGPSSVKVGEKYWYIFTAVDPDRNPIQLFVDWGDGNSGWVGEYASGEQIWVEHEWSTRGTYQVKAKVKDVMGEESGWGYLQVTVPVNKIVISSPFLRLLEQHPNMFPILRYMLLNQYNPLGFF